MTKFERKAGQRPSSKRDAKKERPGRKPSSRPDKRDGDRERPQGQEQERVGRGGFVTKKFFSGDRDQDKGFSDKKKSGSRFSREGGRPSFKKEGGFAKKKFGGRDDDFKGKPRERREDAGDRPRRGSSFDERRPEKREEGWKPRGRGDSDSRKGGSFGERRESKREGGWNERREGEDRPRSPRKAGSFDERRTEKREGTRPVRRREDDDRPRPARKSGDFDESKPRRWENKFGDGDSKRPPRKSSGFDDRRPKRRENSFGDSDFERPVRKSRSFDGERPERDRKGPARDKPKKAKASDDGKIRLNKYLSNAGVASRRDADQLIQSGAVTVNGEVITQLGYKINPDDKVSYGGESVKNERKVYLVLNKPKDYITTMDDPRERKTVMMLIEGACRERVYPVGRLDRNTTGVLLFTNDGELAAKLTHPKHNIKKIYNVSLNKGLRADHFKNIIEGVELEDGVIAADDLAFVGEGKKEVGIEIHSGRNRVVRRLFEHLGYDVLKLDRVSFAGLTKKDIPRGKFRFLTPKEVSFLKMIG